MGGRFEPHKRKTEVLLLGNAVLSHWQQNADLQQRFLAIDTYVHSIQEDIERISYTYDQEYVSEKQLRIKIRIVEDEIKEYVTQVKAMMLYKLGRDEKRTWFPTSRYHRKGLEYYQEFLEQWKAFIPAHSDLHNWFIEDTGQDVPKLEELVNQFATLKDMLIQCDYTQQQRSGFYVYKNILSYILRSFGWSEGEVKKTLQGGSD